MVEMRFPRGSPSDESFAPRIIHLALFGTIAHRQAVSATGKQLPSYLCVVCTYTKTASSCIGHPLLFAYHAQLKVVFFQLTQHDLMTTVSLQSEQVFCSVCYQWITRGQGIPAGLIALIYACLVQRACLHTVHSL